MKDHPHPLAKDNLQTTEKQAKMTDILHPLSFLIPSDSHPISSAKDIPSPPSLAKTFEEGLNRVGTKCNQFNHLGPSHLGMRSSQIRCSTLDSCHCSWLYTLSLHSIHIVQSMMPQMRCPILIFLTK